MPFRKTKRHATGPTISHGESSSPFTTIPRSQLISATHDVPTRDALVLAIWGQQWPRLKRAFPFLHAFVRRSVVRQRRLRSSVFAGIWARPIRAVQGRHRRRPPGFRPCGVVERRACRSERGGRWRSAPPFLRVARQRRRRPRVLSCRWHYPACAFAAVCLGARRCRACDIVSGRDDFRRPGTCGALVGRASCCERCRLSWGERIAVRHPQF